MNKNDKKKQLEDERKYEIPNYKVEFNNILKRLEKPLCNEEILSLHNIIQSLYISTGGSLNLNCGINELYLKFVAQLDVIVLSKYNYHELIILMYTIMNFILSNKVHRGIL